MVLGRPEFQIPKPSAKFPATQGEPHSICCPGVTADPGDNIFLKYTDAARATISLQEMQVTFRTSGKEPKSLRPANFSVWWPFISSPEPDWSSQNF
ncbi:MAG TPA: hypothetical protein VJ731_15100 [Terriglobales bacterium]|nr:hypothetical protein [Terriglobales bacterium]